MSDEIDEEIEEHHIKHVSIYFLFFAMLLAMVLILSKQLHKSPRINAIVSEAALVLLVGMFISFVVDFFLLVDEATDDDGYYDPDKAQTEQYAEEPILVSLVTFEPNVFFMGLLPPILFNAGYELRRELFYRHIRPIALFAVVGTTLSAIVTAIMIYFIQKLGWVGSFSLTFLELLTFGSLIAATDTVSTLAVFQAKKVDPHIFYLVFGESALNDAVALVLFHSFADFLTKDLSGVENMLWVTGSFMLDFTYEAMGSPLLGIISAFLSALIFKVIDMRETKVLELSLYILLMYIPFIMAENVFLSGIVTIFFTGMSARRYVEPNVSDETKHNAEAIFKLTAFLAETVIFLQLGLSFFGLWGFFKWRFILGAFVASLLGRACSIYPISFYYNYSITEKVPARVVEFDGTQPGGRNGSTVKEKQDDDSIKSAGSWSSNSSWTRRETPAKRKDKEIPTSFMHILWFAGIRGAVAYACARKFPDVNGNRNAVITATSTIVVLTIVGMGSATGPLLQQLGIRMGVSEDEYMREWHKQRKLKGAFHRFEYKYVFRAVVRRREKPAGPATRILPNNQRPLEPPPEGVSQSFDEDEQQAVELSARPKQSQQDQQNDQPSPQPFNYMDADLVERQRHLFHQPTFPLDHNQQQRQPVDPPDSRPFDYCAADQMEKHQQLRRSVLQSQQPPAEQQQDDLAAAPAASPIQLGYQAPEMDSPEHRLT